MTSLLAADSGWCDVRNRLFTHQERELVWVGTVVYTAGAPSTTQVNFTGPPDFTINTPFKNIMVKEAVITGVIQRAAGANYAIPLDSTAIGSGITYVGGNMSVSDTGGTLNASMTPPITFTGFSITQLTYVAKLVLWDAYPTA